MDVALAQRLLRNHFTAIKKADTKNRYANLSVNGHVWPILTEAIKAFQTTVVGTKKPDGRIDPGGATFKALLNAQSKPPTSVRDCILGLDANLYTIKLANLPTAHFKTCFKQYHGLTVTKGEELAGFVARLKADPDITDVRWAAYIETEYSFKPINERGKGQGKGYAKEIEVTDTDGIRGKKGEKYKNVYYGRGYVQITHSDNYKRVGKAIGQGDKLYIDPDLTLKEEIAYTITTHGMRNGSFTPGVNYKLSDYFSGSKTDYLGARAIINDTDRDKDIAIYANLHHRTRSK